MLIDEIYKEVYVKLNKDVMQDDLSISNQLALLVEEINVDQLDKRKLEDLLCRAAVIGQARGFVSGVRFWAKLNIEVIS